jgi:hypothetical protein
VILDQHTIPVLLFALSLGIVVIVVVSFFAGSYDGGESPEDDWN